MLIRNALLSYGNTAKSYGNTAKSYGNAAKSYGNAAKSYGNIEMQTYEIVIKNELKAMQDYINKDLIVIAKYISTNY